MFSFWTLCETTYKLGVSPTKDFHSRIGIVDIRLIVESYVWGRGQNTLPRVKSDTVIITDVNKQGKCVMDDSQIQTG